VAVAPTPEWHPAAEEYCETIFELLEDDVEVIQARIAERLDVSRPAVSEMIHRLAEDGLVDLDSRRIALTEAGRELATRVVRRHRLAERFLTDMLDLSWAEAHHEAGKWEHVISEPVEKALLRVLGDPTTCPHGNPIPDSGYTAPDAAPLAEVRIGTAVTVTRIPEELEFTDGLLEYLETSGLTPGTEGTVLARSPDGTLSVQFADTPVAVSSYVAERVLVSTG